MLYWLLSPELTGVALFQFITFRTAAAALTAMLITLFSGGWMIRKLREFQIGQQIRQEGPASHQTKAGTPTMGGLLILANLIVQMSGGHAVVPWLVAVAPFAGLALLLVWVLLVSADNSTPPALLGHEVFIAMSILVLGFLSSVWR